jgi:hypothetical protein
VVAADKMLEGAVMETPVPSVMDASAPVDARPSPLSVSPGPTAAATTIVSVVPVTGGFDTGAPRHLTMMDESLVIIEDVLDDDKDEDKDKDDAAAPTPSPLPAPQMLCFTSSPVRMPESKWVPPGGAGAHPCLLSPHPSSQPCSLRADPRLDVGWRTSVTSISIAHPLLPSRRHRTWKLLVEPLR